MNPLMTLQNAFQAYLLGESEQFEQEIAGATKAFKKQRLAIYSDAYYLRLIGILKIDFPGLDKWLGDKAFTKLCTAYIEQYPSKFFSGRDFGQYMADFLASNSPYNKTGFLSEFARFERILSETIDSPDANILTVQKFITIPTDNWPQMRFILHSTVQCIPLSWNIPDIRTELIVNETKIARKHYKKASPWMIWRKVIDVKYKQLDEQEYFVINSMANRMTFEEICVGLMQWMPEQEAAQYIVHFLQTWLPEQIFSAVSVG